jgi:hypothetical protein
MGMDNKMQCMGIELMDHNEAIQKMVAERYLLNELAPDALEAFEEHLFDCPECALDLRAGAAFVDEAKAQLPELMGPPPHAGRSATGRPGNKLDGWLAWWRPAFVAPAFAALLLVFGYQNLVTVPALRASANEPRLVPLAPLHGATRSGPAPVITADRKRGVALPIDLAADSGSHTFASYSVNLYDHGNKLAWTGAAGLPVESKSGDQLLFLELPGSMLRDGSYTVEVFGVDPHGERTAIETFVFKVRLSD